jgi:hypothetical protein
LCDPDRRYILCCNLGINCMKTDDFCSKFTPKVEP